MDGGQELRATRGHPCNRAPRRLSCRSSPPLGISPTTHTLFKLKRDICERIFSVVSVNDALHRLPTLRVARAKYPSHILSHFNLRIVYANEEIEGGIVKCV